MNNKPIRRFLRYALSTSLLLVLIAGTVTVYAAFPGANGKIAFNTNRDGNQEIYVMNPDGSYQINLTNNSADDAIAAWSPDGSKIAFTSNRDGNYQIFVMNADGTNVIRLTDNPDLNGYTSWSPDGSKIAFVSDRDGNPEVYLMNADGTGQTRLTNSAGEDHYPAWSPDGSKIAFTSTRDGNYEIFVMNADGASQTNLTNYPGASESSANWSPDGTKIVFISNRDAGNFEIYVMNADGTSQINLTQDPGFDEEPAWSPDGTKIVFDSLRFGNDDIYVMNADGTGQANIGNNPTSAENTADWQPKPIFDFTGFFQPVDNLPTLNLVKAGQGVPVKFSLNGDQGLDIFAAGYPISQQINCDSSAVVDGIELTLAAGSSSLSYDPVTDTYTYVWKTDKAWANTCRQLILKLNDGTFHRANFNFTR